MVVFGKQSASFLITNKPHMIEEIYLTKKVDTRLYNDIKKLNIPIKTLDFKKAQALARGRNHQGILLICKDLVLSSMPECNEVLELLVLCNISDIGNIGSMIRTAYALGIGAIIISDINLSQNAIEGIIRTSSGAALDIPIVNVANSLHCANELSMAHFSLIGADIQGVDIKEFCSRRCDSSNAYSIIESHHPQNLSRNFPTQKLGQIKNLQAKITSHKWALFMGNENEGLRPKLLKKMDSIVKVSMRRDFNSLNVAHACAIILDRLMGNSNE